MGGLVVLAAGPGTAPPAAGIAVIVAAAALQPAAGLLLLAAALPFYLFPRSFGSLSFSVPELVLLATVSGAFLHVLALRLAGKRLPQSGLGTPFDRPIALFLAAALLSLLASEVLRVSLRDLRTLILEPVAAYYLAAWFLPRGRLPWLIGALVAGGVAAALLGFYQYFFTSHVVAVEGARRMLGPYLSPNQMGLYMGRSLPLALAAALFVPSARPVAAAAALVLAAALALTFSVGAWLGTLLGVAAVLALWRPKAPLALAGGVAAAAVLGLSILASEPFTSHLSLGKGTSFIRLQVWDSSIRMIRDHPILGAGMDNFLYHYRGAYFLPEAVAEPNLSHPHNVVLNFWLQLGILGLAAFGWLAASLARAWRQLWRTTSDQWQRAMLAGTAGVAVDFLAHGMVDNSYFLVDLAFHFWLLAGVIAVLSRDPAG